MKAQAYARKIEVSIISLHSINHTNRMELLDENHKGAQCHGGYHRED